MRITLAAEHPNEILLSGPGVGVVFAADLGRLLGRLESRHARHGWNEHRHQRDPERRDRARPARARSTGQEIGTPMTEIHTIGPAAARSRGSEGRPDQGRPAERRGRARAGLLRPRRNRANGHDANVMLGYLDPSRFLGGRMQGDPQLATRRSSAWAARWSWTRSTTAIGVNRIVNTHMAIGSA